MAELVPVRVRGCECPGAPHAGVGHTFPDGTTIDGDVIYMRPTISLDGGLAAEHDNATAHAEGITAGILAAGGVPKEGWSEDQENEMARDISERLRRKWLATYVRYGAVGWNFLDADGPVPFDVDAILDDYGLAQPVAEKGDELYGETVNRPLVARRAKRSPSGPKADSISPKKRPIKRQSARLSPDITAASGQLSA